MTEEPGTRARNFVVRTRRGGQNGADSLRGHPMDFVDLFFPEVAQASHLRRIAHQQSFGQRSRSDVTQDEFDALEREVREVRLYLTALSQLLVEKGLVRPDELQAKVLALLLPLPAVPNDDNPFAGMK